MNIPQNLYSRRTLLKSISSGFGYLAFSALAAETSADSKERLEDLKRQIANREEEVNSLKARWESEKEVLSRLKPLQEEIDRLRMESEQAVSRAQQTNNNDEYPLIYILLPPIIAFLISVVGTTFSLGILLVYLFNWNIKREEAADETEGIG